MCVHILSYRFFPLAASPFGGDVLGTAAAGFTRSCDPSHGSESAGPQPPRPPLSSRSKLLLSLYLHVLQIRAPRAKHSHNAPQVSGYSASAGPPTIAVAALLRLSRWCRQRSDVRGEASCGDKHPQQRPPARGSGEPGHTDPAPLGPTQPRSAGSPCPTRRTAACPTPTDGRPSGGQP